MPNPDADPTVLAGEVDAALEQRFAALAADPVLADGQPGALEAARAFLRTGGKRMRPVLFLLAYRGYALRPLRGALDFAVALELLHSFALIHDDLLDGAETRRGAPALHRWFAERVDAPSTVAEKTGRDLAMLTGDVLHAAAIEAAATADVQPGRRDRALADLLRTAMQTGAGVHQEVALRERPVLSIGRDDILAVYDRKTVRYTFACPLRMAALLGGAPTGELDRLAALAHALGTAYQILDDVADLQAFLDGDPEAGGMRLAEAKLMLPLHEALRGAGDADREWAADLFAHGVARAPDRRRLATLLVATDAINACDAEAASLLDTAHACIRGLALPEAFREALDRFAGRLRPASAASLQGVPA